MALHPVLAHQTKEGPVFISRSDDGRFHVVWQGESLGSYATIALAVGDASGGHTSAEDLSALGVPDDPTEWVKPQDLHE